jgi:hypothetical protein
MPHESPARPSDAYEEFWAAVDTPAPVLPAGRNVEPPTPGDAYEQFSAAAEN